MVLTLVSHGSMRKNVSEKATLQPATCNRSYTYTELTAQNQKCRLGQWLELITLLTWTGPTTVYK